MAAALTEEKRPGGWFTTITGRRAWVLDPRPGEISLRDIVCGLARCCRFAGHVSCPLYPVAQHSVLVSEIAEALAEEAGLEPGPIAFDGLFHDGTEAYLGDMIKPLKEALPGYKKIERRWALAIGQALGVGDRLLHLHPLIKRADNIALATERRDVQSRAQQLSLAQHGVRECEDVEPDPRIIVPLSAPEAEALFWRRLRELDPAMARRAEAA